MTQPKKKIAYHFVGDTLRDGTPVPKNGVWLKHTGVVRMCESGLHFSYDPFDALEYAPGPILCMVEVDGVVQVGTDKGVCSKRKIIKRFDCTDILNYFARMQALSVIHLWEQTPPDVVLDFLMTGDESLRAAARDAAWAAARDAAWAAARAPARDAAWYAAWYAARIEFNSLINAEFASLQ